MVDRLGYVKHDRVGRNGQNCRKGIRSRTVMTEVGPVELDVPPGSGWLIRAEGREEASAPARWRGSDRALVDGAWTDHRRGRGALGRRRHHLEERINPSDN